MLTVFFTELCFSSSISVLRYCIKWKMSETFRILNLSPRCPDESGERRASVVAVDLNLIRCLVDLATKWISCARKNTRRKNSNTQACEIHPVHAIQGKSIAWLVNSTLNFTRENDIFLVKFNVEFTRQAIDFPIKSSAYLRTMILTCTTVIAVQRHEKLSL